MNKKLHKVDNEDAFTTTELGRRLGFQVSAYFVESVLGIPADYKTKSTTMWKEKRFGIITHALSAHCYNCHKENRKEARISRGMQ